MTPPCACHLLQLWEDAARPVQSAYELSRRQRAPQRAGGQRQRQRDDGPAAGRAHGFDGAWQLRERAAARSADVSAVQSGGRRGQVDRSTVRAIPLSPPNCGTRHRMLRGTWSATAGSAAAAALMCERAAAGCADASASQRGGRRGQVDRAKVRELPLSPPNCGTRRGMLRGTRSATAGAAASGLRHAGCARVAAQMQRTSRARAGSTAASRVDARACWPRGHRRRVATPAMLSSSSWSDRCSSTPGSATRARAG